MNFELKPPAFGNTLFESIDTNCPQSNNNKNKNNHNNKNNQNNNNKNNNTFLYT